MSKKKKTGKRIAIVSVIGVIVIALIALAIFARPQKWSNYTEETAKTGDITTYYSFTGNVSAKNSQFVYADSAMLIKEIDVTEGQTVKKDELLMKTTTGREIKAPIDGTVSEIDADVDAQQMPGAKLLKVVDYSNLELQVQVDEYDLPSITVDKAATVTVNALNKDVSGTVTEVSREGISQNGVTYFNAKVSLPNESDLRVGMTAQAKILNQSVKAVTTLPMSTIQFNSDNTPYVYMKGDKNRLEKIDVTLGVNDGTTVEIKSGLKSGDTVLVPPTSTTATGFGMGMRSGTKSNTTGSTSSAAALAGGSSK